MLKIFSYSTLDPRGLICVTPQQTGEQNNQEETTICTMEYAPVCASVQVECIQAPCEPIEETFGNKCMMNANKKATFLYEGECKTK